MRRLAGWPARVRVRDSSRMAVLRPLGRWALWAVIALLLVRGAADVLATEKPRPVRSERRSAVVWPDDAARGFAVEFARAYLSYSPAHPRRYAAELGRFASGELVAQLVPRFAAQGSRQVVQAATAAGVELLGRDRALVTVAARVADRQGVGTWWLAVPVARARGGLAVFDLPSFVAPPARAEVPVLEPLPLAGRERAAIEDVVSRFLRAYVAGERDELALLVAPGVRIEPLDRPLQVWGPVSVASAGGAGRSRRVLAALSARDPRSQTVFSLRYRLRLRRGDRWHVAAVNPARKDG